MKDEFLDIIESVEVEKKSFKLFQLKLEHFYFNSGDIDVGIPVSTSVELVSDYNFEERDTDWKVIVKHTFLSFEDCRISDSLEYVKELPNIDDVLKQLKSIDLRDLKNNYYTDENPEKLSHWEITYNNIFKIVGTYDQEIKEFKTLSKLLDFKNIMKEEVEKVSCRLDALKGEV